MIQIILHTAGTIFDFTALASVIGMAWCLMALTPRSTFPEIMTVRMQRFLIASLLLLTVSSIDSLIQRGIEMSGLGIISIFPLLPTVIFKSHYGSMWLVRIAGLVAAWLIVLAGRRWSGSRLFGLLLFCSAAVVAFSRSASGHPADFGDLSTHQIADWLHLVAVSCWAGALLAVTYIFPPSLVTSDKGDHPFIAGIADRFYLLFGPLLAILVATGIYNARSTVGSFQALADTTYGRLLLAKLALLALLAIRSVAPPSHGNDNAGYVMKFLRRSRIDALLVIWILLIVSQIVHTIPALHQGHLAQAKESAYNSKEGGQPIVILTTEPRSIVAGSPVRMIVSLRDPDGKPLHGLEISHERILHAIIISRDLSFFAHIHTEDIGPVTAAMLKDSVLPLQVTFPKAGEYLIGFDFAANDEAFSKTVSVTVVEAPAMRNPVIDLSLTKNFGDYRVSLELPPGGVRAGTDTTLRFMIEKNGKAVTDLEPYLGASMHLAVVPADLKAFIHAHGEIPGEEHAHHDHLHAEAPAKFGPEIDADLLMPAKGIYKIFSQVQHKGKILLFDFMVDVQ
jgi:putative copper export protein